MTVTSPRLDLGTLCVLDTCDNQLHHEAIPCIANKYMPVFCASSPAEDRTRSHPKPARWGGEEGGGAQTTGLHAASGVSMRCPAAVIAAPRHCTWRPLREPNTDKPTLSICPPLQIWPIPAGDRLHLATVPAMRERFLSAPPVLRCLFPQPARPAVSYIHALPHRRGIYLSLQAAEAGSYGGDDMMTMMMIH